MVLNAVPICISASRLPPVGTSNSMPQLLLTQTIGIQAKLVVGYGMGRSRMP